MRASLPLAVLLLLLALAGALCRVPARHVALPSSKPGGPVALAPAQRQLLQLVTAVGVAAADGGNDDESAVAAVPAPEAEASGQACYDMRVNFGAACQVRWGIHLQLQCQSIAFLKPRGVWEGSPQCQPTMLHA